MWMFKNCLLNRIYYYTSVSFFLYKNMTVVLLLHHKITDARCVRKYSNYIIQQGEELTCLHFFKWSC